MAEGFHGSKEDSHSSSHSNIKRSSNNGSNKMNDNSRNNDYEKYLVNGNIDERICRDFIRNVCNRGNRCKYRHPTDVKSSKLTNKRDCKEITFCHDFRNGYCPRSSCRFIHCSNDEEDRYLNSGELMPHLLEQMIYKGQILETLPKCGTPICKDFIMGDCVRKRGGKCRFRHLTKYEYKQELMGSRFSCDSQRADFDDNYNSMENGNMSSMGHESKRPRFDSSNSERDFMRSIDDHGRGSGDMPSRDISLWEYRDRERELDRERDRRGLEEVLLLRKQLETLKKEIVVLKKENSDLRATNDFLLEKITTLGMTKGGGTVTTVTVPAVSIASTIPVATSVQPLTAAQVSHPLSIASECCSVGSVVAMPTGPPQPQPPAQSLAPATQMAVAPPPTAVLGPVGGVQVTLSQALAPNAASLSTVNLNSMGPQTSMAPSIAPPPPGSAPNIPQGMSMSGASGHLVTYPIMTQPALRQQMQ